MAFFIEKIIFHNRAPFDHLELSFEKNDIILLNAYNGGGKTTIISHIADAFFELTRPFYQNEFKNKPNEFYRVSSSMFNLNASKPSFVYIRFSFVSNHGEKKRIIDYIDVRNKCSEEEYNEAISLNDKIPFHEFSTILENNSCAKHFSSIINKDIVQSIVNNNLLTYFPAYRFEYPGYLNNSYSNGIKFDKETKYSGYLPNQIEIVTGLSNLMNWMMDVILDWQINKSVKDVQTKDGKIIQIDVTPERMKLDTLNKLINLSIVNNKSGTLRLGVGKRINPSQRISIMLETSENNAEVKYPSIVNLSMGELAIITLFGEILHQADNIGFNSNASGIVLIDEVDSHLHIKLQKEILPQLLKLFPNIQFIISSHSPFVGMGISETMNNRLQYVFLSNNTGVVIPSFCNPLYSEVYEMMIRDNENYKKQYESLLLSTTKNKKVLVEDKYDQIYKIAWLKLKDISFTKETIDDIFKVNAPFDIFNNFSANGVAGCLSVKNYNLFNNQIIIGLFDFDKEGSERFYNLIEGFNSKDDIMGELSSGFYKAKKTNGITKIYGLMLPVPSRLYRLIARSECKNNNLWKGEGFFANFVEVESLLQEDFSKNSNSFELENTFGINHYVVKDDKKSSLWIELVNQPKEVFFDFIPLFKKLYELFELGIFVD